MVNSIFVFFLCDLLLGLLVAFFEDNYEIDDLYQFAYKHLHSPLIRKNPNVVLEDLKMPLVKASIIFFAPYIDPFFEHIAEENADELSLFYYVQWPFSNLDNDISSRTYEEETCGLLLEKLGVKRVYQKSIADQIKGYYLKVG
jgi:hypothetical protein